MSLIPYQSREGREIVLRHRNAIVVRDPTSHRLEIRGLTECPTCHQPLRSSSPERHGYGDNNNNNTSRQDTYVDPDYFRMLRAGRTETTAENPPSSPIRRLIRPVLPHAQPTALEESEDAQFVSSTPSVQEGSRIRREAFSPNYFKTFFVEEKELGRGGKGIVLLVRHEIDGCHLGYFACKRVPVGDDHAWLEKVLIEVELLAKLSHPNLVSYRHVWLEDVQLTRFGPSVACAFILQQYCNGGDLLNYLIGDKPKQTTKEELKEQMRRRSKGEVERPKNPLSGRCLSFEEIFSLFKDVTSGLAYLHAANYIHRDLKPSNCLLHREGGNLTCLISDFGEVQPGNTVRNSTGTTGTISYCAPEVLRQGADGRFGNFSTKSDIFSLGMILYFMCFGRLPYRSANAINEELEDVDELRAEITDWQGFLDERRERPDLPAKLYQLLKQLLALDPAQRPSANEVLTAMNSESTSTETFHRGRSASPSVNLQQARRVQNLDSPLPPSTPVPDPSKQSQPRPERSGLGDHVLGSVEDGGSSVGRFERRSGSGSGLRNSAVETTLQHVPRPMASSPVRENYASQSPERPTTSSDGSVHSPKGSPPLLMAPPMTWSSDARYRLSLTWYHLTTLTGLRETCLPHYLRLSIFLAKVATIARPCWPYMMDPWLGVFLVTIAGVDLGIANRRQGEPSSNVVVRRLPAQGAAGFLGAADVRLSLLLSLVHVAVLWGAGRWANICAAPVDSWHAI